MNSPEANRLSSISSALHRRKFLLGGAAALLSQILPAHGALNLAHISGTSYASLSSVAGALGMNRQWLSKGKRITVESTWTNMRFEVHKRDFDLNGVRVWLGDPVAGHGGDLWISQRDYERTIQPILTPKVFSDVPKLYRIVLDPGHGGKDSGAVDRRRNHTEKTYALDLAKRLKRLLEPHGYNVVLTRHDDTFLSLGSRPAIANRIGADLFVSLHYNAAEATAAEGVETFIYTPRYQPSTGRATLHSSDRVHRAANDHDVWNALAGFYVHREMVENLGMEDRGLKRARWAVLQGLTCPGMLVEGGFLSNAGDAAKVNSASHRERQATVITEGILRYQHTLDVLRGRV